MNLQRQAPRRLLPLALLYTALLLLLLVSCQRPASANAAGGIVLDGTFNWSDGGDEPTALQASFTPSQTLEAWDVVFTFRLNGSRHKWKGQIQATDGPSTPLGEPAELAVGPITGTVSTGRGRNLRTWEISGEFTDGVLRATHAERDRRGRLEPSGSLLLRRVN